MDGRRDEHRGARLRAMQHVNRQGDRRVVRQLGDRQVDEPALARLDRQAPDDKRLSHDGAFPWIAPNIGLCMKCTRGRERARARADGIVANIGEQILLRAPAARSSAGSIASAQLRLRSCGPAGAHAILRLAFGSQDGIQDDSLRQDIVFPRRRLSPRNACTQRRPPLRLSTSAKAPGTAIQPRPAA